MNSDSFPIFNCQNFGETDKNINRQTEKTTLKMGKTSFIPSLAVPPLSLSVYLEVRIAGKLIFDIQCCFLNPKSKF